MANVADGNVDAGEAGINGSRQRWPTRLQLTRMILTIVSCPCLSADPCQSYKSRELKTVEKQLCVNSLWTNGDIL